MRCPDRPGIVAVLSRLLADSGADIVESQQHSSDPVGGTFLLRLEFVLADLAGRRHQLEGALQLLAGQWGMSWRLTEAARVPRLAVFVSRADHVLQELLHRVGSGDLRPEIAAVVSDHPDLEPVARAHGVPLHHVPVTPDTRTPRRPARWSSSGTSTWWCWPGTCRSSPPTPAAGSRSG